MIAINKITEKIAEINRNKLIKCQKRIKYGNE